MDVKRSPWLTTELAAFTGIAGGAFLAAGISWLSIRGSVRGGDGWIGTAMPGPDMLAGWLMLLMLLGTMAAILVGAQARLMGLLVIGLGMALSALLVPLVFAAISSGELGTVVVLRIAAVLAGWISFCTAITRLLRPLGPAMAVGAAATLAMALLAMPVVLMPPLALLAGLTPHWPLTVAVNACPTLWLLDAAGHAMGFNWFWWSHARLMYQFTGLGQNTRMPTLQPWWVPTAISSAVAAAIFALTEGNVKKLFLRRPVS